MAAMLTTVDNPHDPREDFPAWYAWDVAAGYDTCAYLARIALVSDDFPEEVVNYHTELAIDEIIKIHADGLYKKLIIEEAA